MTPGAYRNAVQPLLLWALLVAMTLCSWETRLFGRGVDPRLLSTIAVVLTFVKIRIVLLDFMDVRRAPWALRIVLELWVVVVGTTLACAYWLR